MPVFLYEFMFFAWYNPKKSGEKIGEDVN